MLSLDPFLVTRIAKVHVSLPKNIDRYHLRRVELPFFGDLKDWMQELYGGVKVFFGRLKGFDRDGGDIDYRVVVNCVKMWS